MNEYYILHAYIQNINHATLQTKMKNENYVQQLAFFDMFNFERLIDFYQIIV